MPALGNRLAAAASLCRRGVVVCDVGTDHAKLACYLAKNGAKAVIASDVREGPLEAARRTVEREHAENVTVVLSDGLEKIDYADDVVVCGMGGELIMDIISGCRFLTKDTRFILQPMTKAETLRRELCLSGFEIIEEKAAREGKRLYTVMLVRFTGERRVADELFCLCGKITDRAMLLHIAGKLRKSAAGLALSENGAKEAQRLKSLAGQIEARAAEV